MRTKSSSLRPSWLNFSPKSLEMVFFDLETTGGNPLNSGITEIAMIKYKKGMEVGRYHSLVNPERPISSQVRKITGITNAMVEKAPTIDKIIDEILGFIGESVLVSHGVIADYAYLQHYSKALRQKNLESFYLCTHLIVSHALPHIPSKSLSGVADYYGVMGETAHRATADAEMTAKIFWRIFEDLDALGFSTVEDLIKVQADHHSLAKLGTKLDPTDVERVPNTPGLLRLFNQKHEVIFCAATPFLKKSIKSFTQMSEDREQNEVTVDAAAFKIQRTKHFLDALISERQQLNKLNLNLDPRRFERRGRGLVQVLFPSDLLEWAVRNTPLVPFRLPAQDHFTELPHADLNAVSDRSVSNEKIRSSIHKILMDQTQVNGTGSAAIPIRSATKSRPMGRVQKYKLDRTPEVQGVFRCDGLVQGTGWYFKPLDGPKAFQRKWESALAQLPFHNAAYSYEERIWFLYIFIQLVLGKVNQVVDLISASHHGFFSKFNPVKVLELRKAKKFLIGLSQEFPGLSLQELPNHGVGILSNNETKELDVFTVVGGRIRKSFSLLREESKRLQSTRLFTRIFFPYKSEIDSPLNPIAFSKQACDDIELFHYWNSQRGEEGEWVNFYELEALYNDKILDT